MTPMRTVSAWARASRQSRPRATPAATELFSSVLREVFITFPPRIATCWWLVLLVTPVFGERLGKSTQGMGAPRGGKRSSQAAISFTSLANKKTPALLGIFRVGRAAQAPIFARFRCGGASDDRLEARNAHRDHVVDRPAPPTIGKNLDLDVPVETVRLDESADTRDINHPVSHHAAIVEHVGRRHQPVADVEGEQALAPGPFDLRRQFEIPPYVIDIEGNAEHAAAPRIEAIADVECLAQRAHAGTICSKHRMQWLDRQRHVCGARIFKHFGDAVFSLRLRRPDILGGCASRS